MPHPDEGLIHAWLDGELSPDEAARVERLVNDDPEWAAAAGEARGLIAASSRILGALDVVPGDVLPTDARVAPATGSAAGYDGRSASASRARSRFSVRPWMRVAAGLVIIVGTTVVVTNRADVESAFEPAGMADRAAAQMQPPAVADPDGRGVVDSVSRREAMRTAADSATLREGAREAAGRERTRVAADSAARSEGERVAAESRTRNEASRAAVPPVPASAPAIADAVSPSQEKSSQSLTMDSAPAPAQRLGPFGSGLVVTPPTETAPAGNATRLSAERGFGAVSAQARPVAAGMTVSATVLDGCWRTITRAAVDSVLVSPRILETAGRMLTIAAGELAVTVVQQADTLRGTITDAGGARVPFRAERIVCRD